MRELAWLKEFFPSANFQLDQLPSLVTPSLHEHWCQYNGNGDFRGTGAGDGDGTSPLSTA